MVRVSGTEIKGEQPQSTVAVEDTGNLYPEEKPPAPPNNVGRQQIKGVGVSWGDENVLKWTVVMVAQLCEQTEGH